MKLARYLAATVCGVALFAPAALAQPVLSFGDLELLANTADQEIQVFVTSDVAVQGLNFNVQIGDGGALAGGSTPNLVQGLDVLTGTIFEGNNNGISSSRIAADGLALDTITTATGTVEANGLLGTLTIDTTGIDAGRSFTISTTTLNGPTDFAGIAATQANGSLTVVAVPEPATAGVMLVTCAGLLLRRRQAA